jgi:hypothetical protein
LVALPHLHVPSGHWFPPVARFLVAGVDVLMAASNPTALGSNLGDPGYPQSSAQTNGGKPIVAAWEAARAWRYGGTRQKPCRPPDEDRGKMGRQEACRSLAFPKCGQWEALAKPEAGHGIEHSVCLALDSNRRRPEQATNHRFAGAQTSSAIGGRPAAPVSDEHAYCWA